MDVLKKVQQSEKWPQQACRTMFFSIPKNVTGERSIALMPTMICWWEALRAPEVATWPPKYRVDWDVADGRNGGAQQTVWEIMTEMERFKYRGEEELGAVAFMLDLAKAFERVDTSFKGGGWVWNPPSSLHPKPQTSVGLGGER